MADRQPDSSLAQADSPLIRDTKQCDATSTLQPLPAQHEQDTGSRTRAKIHWLTPAAMLLSYIVGICLAVGHHLYYTMLDGDVVGSTDRQQWSLRFGNAFAISISLSLKIAVGIAYTQLLWMCLQKRPMSLGSINDCFDISGNLSAFFNFELFKKLQLGLLIALVLWCLPLPTLFAPATLSVETRTSQSSSMEQALKAEVNNLTVADAFIYRLAADLYWISGPSARLGRIAGAVIGSGERLQFESPTSHQNTSYETQNFLPLLKCDTANSTVREDVWRLVNDTEVDTAWVHNMTAGSLKWATSEHSGEVGYLGTIYPRRLEGGNSGGLTWNETESTTRHYVFAIQRQPTELEYQSDTEYLSCVLWNASVSYTVKKQNGIVAIGDIHREYINEFEPLEAYVDDRSACSICEGSGAPAYSGYSIALSKYLLGYIAWNQDNTRHRYLTVGSLGTTSLSTGAQFYNMNRNMNEAGLVIGTIQNPSNVRNISFREDVEAFALNLSLSIINDASLCTKVPVNLTIYNDAFVYTYNPENLLISYGVAVFCSTIAICFGLYAILRNGACYDNRVSTFSAAMQSFEVKEALGDSQARVAQPLNNKTAKIKLRFDAKEGFVLGKRRQASES